MSQEAKNENFPTEEVQYPCPRCGTYSKAQFYSKDGYAFMLCPECKTQFKTSTKASINFRKFCSRIATGGNISQTKYSSLEKKVRRILEKKGYVQGRDFLHNVLIENGRRKYYVDFLLYRKNMVLECNGSIWHKLWNRKESDKRKIEYLKSLGFKILIVDEKNYEEELEELNEK